MIAPDEKHSTVVIKGYREGLLATLPEGSWEAARQDLLQQIEVQGSFFHGARLAVDVGPYVVHAAEMSGLRNTLADMGVTLSTILSTAPQTLYTARMLGLAQSIRPASGVLSSYSPAPGEDARIIKGRLLPGMRCECPTDLTVIGDVPAGVQLEAGGSIIVWGRLLGSVHAGIGSHEDAVVSALDLHPSMLRIAGMLYSRVFRAALPRPRTAHIQNGIIVITPWSRLRQAA